MVRDIAEEAREVSPLVRDILSRRAEGRDSCEGLIGFKKLDGKRLGEAIIAVDGGNRSLDFSDFTFYLARAWAGTQSGSEALYNAIGVVVPPVEPEARISIYREVLEAYTALELVRRIEGPGVILLDGSPATALKWWRPGFARRDLMMSQALETAKRVLVDVDLSILGIECSVKGECVEDLVSKAVRRPASAKLGMILARSNTYSAKDLRWLIAVEVAEKLYLYMSLLREAWRKSITPIFVAKTSRSSEACGGPLPDVAYLYPAAPPEPSLAVLRRDAMVKIGIENILGLGGDEASGRFIPDVGDLRRFYTEMVAEVRTYVRLSPAGPILSVSALVPSSTPELLNPAEYIAEVLKPLIDISPSGYPLHLLIAHERAKVSSQDLESSLLVMGLSLEGVGRSVLRL
ncbi:MAG: DNA double-strand break repair nuclease NurA [Aeropyrum sp.]|nr:DNA double-strand break repair nuclease NurA [Aeropyrum sp.]MCE4615950.1 DNA double-strand break repair nuclease NurA [Aeropyrum sp.]